MAQWSGEWHLLSLADGTEQARQPQCGDSYDFAADGERIYASCEAAGRTLVHRIEDLAILSDREPAIGPWDVGFVGDGHLVAAALIGHDAQIVALSSRR